MLLAEKQKKKQKRQQKPRHAMGMDAGLCRPWCELACCSKPKHDIRTQEKVQLTHCTPPAAANIQFSNSQAANKNILKLQTASTSSTTSTGRRGNPSPGTKSSVCTTGAVIVCIVIAMYLLELEANLREDWASS